MKVLGYLLRTTMKNRILSLRKKPGMLILYLICFGSLALLLVSSFILNDDMEVAKKYSDIRILYAIIAGIGLFFSYSFVSTGLTNGSTLFNMADVRFLFTAPVSSKKILLYGLIKQMGTVFLTSIFILFQMGTLKNSFGLDSILILNIFIIYAIMIFSCQLISMAVYIFSNGNAIRKKIVAIMFGALLAAIAAGLLFEYKQTGNITESMLRIADNKIFGFVPVAGWSTMFFKASIEQNMIFMILAILLYVLLSLILITSFTSGKADYYEDVLKSTEIMFNTQQAAKDGKRVTVSKKKVKVKNEDNGIGYGKGAFVFFYKHLVEMKRTSRFLFIDTYTITAVIGTIIACNFVKNAYINYIIFGVLLYIQFISTVMGKLSTELTKPYIYLIPEKSIKKVFIASLTNMIKPFVDGAVICITISIASNTSPSINLFLAIAYASTGVLLVSYTILCQKLLGGQPNQFVQAMVGTFLFFIVLSPGIGISVAAIIMLPEVVSFLGTLPYTLCAIVISAIIFALCGNLLDNAEFNGK